MKRILFTIVLFVGTMVSTWAQQDNGSADYGFYQNISYVDATETDAYRLERCKLDVYVPLHSEGFPTLIWFHGGGLTSKEKELPKPLMEEDLAVVSPNYRLYPQALCPSYIEDAAQAVAWTIRHIAEYGGDPTKVYVSGHSAGGYLALILAMAKEYLAAYGIDADRDVAGYLPVSGQTMTHFTIRKEYGLPDGIPAIDKYAPIFHARANTARMTLITGDRQLEMADRWEENAFFYSVNKNLGNKQMELFELQGFNHLCVNPACHLIINKLRDWEKEWGLKYYRKKYPEHFK